MTSRARRGIGRGGRLSVAAAVVAGSLAPGVPLAHAADGRLPAPKPAHRVLDHASLRGHCDRVFYTEINGKLFVRSTFGGGDKLDEVTIVKALRSGGFTWQEMPMALAVVAAESERCPKAMGYNLSPTGTVLSTDVGMWQINTTWHPQFATWNLKDPFVASKAAKQIFAKAGWKAWRGYEWHSIYDSWAAWAITVAKDAGVS